MQVSNLEYLFFQKKKKKHGLWRNFKNCNLSFVCILKSDFFNPALGLHYLQTLWLYLKLELCGFKDFDGTEVHKKIQCTFFHDTG